MSYGYSSPAYSVAMVATTVASALELAALRSAARSGVVAATMVAFAVWATVVALE